MIGSVPPPYHGSSVYFRNLLNSRLKSEFDIHHLDISDHRDLNNLSKLDFTNVKIALMSILNLSKMIKSIKPDLIYIPVSSNYLPYLRDGLFMLTSSLYSNASIVIHLHEGNYFRENFYKNSFFIFKYFINFSLGKVDTAIVYSESLKSNFEGLVKNVTAFPNGLDVKPESVNLFDNVSDSEKPFITFLGNLFESKGVLDVLTSSVSILKKYGNAVFNFAGEWIESEKETKLKADKIITENNLMKNIKFHGVLNGAEREKLILNSDFIVFPTRYPYEGCPLVIIEAMAYGKPVISSKDTGAIPDMVDDGITGILIEKNNVAEITDAMMTLIESQELREKMGKAGRVKYENSFTFEKNIDNIINTFYKVLN